MKREIRVYPDPNHSIRFNRYATVQSAIKAGKYEAGIFGGGKPSKVRFYTGRGWSLHMCGPRGRVVISGDFLHIGDVAKFMAEVAHA